MLAQPFDLRRWLLNHLVNFEGLPAFYKFLVIISFFCFIFLSIFPCVPALVARVKSSQTKEFLLSNITYIICLIVFIFTVRWPGFLASELNPDESFFISGAMKLLKDPVFWRSVETSTSGPLNVYPLTVPALMGLKIEYASARVIGLFLVIIAVICLYFSLRVLYGNTLARLSIVPIVTTFALMKFDDYVHYTSEHVSIAILSVALLIVCQFYASRSTNQIRKIFTLGLLLGMIPYAKLQALPIAAAIALIFVHILWQENLQKSEFSRNLFAFILGSILFSCLIFFGLLIFSLSEDFWKVYVQQNLFYATQGVTGNPLNFWEKTHQFLIMLGSPNDTKVLFSLTAIILILGLPFLLKKRRSLNYNPAQSNSFIFVYYSLFILVSAIYSITKTGSGFTHYLLFLIVPSGFLIGVFLGELQKILQSPELIGKKSRFSLLTVIVVIIVAINFLQVAKSVKTGNHYINNRRQYTENYISPVAKTILKYASTDESMAIWGWASKLHIETGIVQAIRDDSTFWQIVPNPKQPYFLERYRDDLLNSNPRLFIDSIAPNCKYCFFRNQKTQRHENFPEIAKVVSQNYKLVDEVQGIRIYVRKGT